MDSVSSSASFCFSSSRMFLSCWTLLKGFLARVPPGRMGSNFLPTCSVLRKRPMESKFSSPKPMTSIFWWHEAQTACCWCMRTSSRLECGLSTLEPSSGTFGGGGEGLSWRIFSMTRAPRMTGDERSPLEPVMRK